MWAESHWGQLLPVALLWGQDEVSGGKIGEDPDGGAFPARPPLFVQRMVVVVHLQGNNTSMGGVSQVHIPTQSSIFPSS